MGSAEEREISCFLLQGGRCSNNTPRESGYDAGVDLFRLRDWRGRGYVLRIKVEVGSKGKREVKLGGFIPRIITYLYLSTCTANPSALPSREPSWRLRTSERGLAVSVLRDRQGENGDEIAVRG